MMAFYDSIDGVQMIFSKDSGRTWGGSKIVLAQFGRSGFYSGGLLFYITDEGIYSKIITESLLSRAFSAVEGSSASDIELIQDAFDDQIVTSLETGPIPTQKLSAHNDETGIFHVFYYDEAGRLSSVQGTDLGWKTTKNF
jgi:YD repeat-containing protein